MSAPCAWPRAPTRWLWLLGVLTAWLIGGPAGAASLDRGRQLYTSHCANCHGERGTPVWPGTPDFKHTTTLLRPDAQLIAVIRRGKGVMPAYAGILRDSELADLVAYLRTLN